ncbi:hypothetical protein JQC91_05905 [Jannaschia sp. Os4]|nr:hypothetical protein [Jannaschia sp. Os4]MBM2575836.1 hypothetical protein [Jannaschia sp. Os4]
MLASIADFLLGAGLARRPASAPFPRRSPSQFRETGDLRGWHSRVGTY